MTSRVSRYSCFHLGLLCVFTEVQLSVSCEILIQLFDVYTNSVLKKPPLVLVCVGHMSLTRWSSLWFQLD